MPDSYRNAPADEIARVVNGCGPGGWKIKIIPDFIFSHDVKPACDIHDWCYYLGGTASDRAFYDLQFHRNLVACCMGSTGCITPLELAVCDQYFLAVRNYGEKFFGVN